MPSVYICIYTGVYFIGHIRGWDAISGYTHNISKTSRERFLSEPFVQEAGVHGRYVCMYLKVRGPFVQTLCIEKDSYMDAI